MRRIKLVLAVCAVMVAMLVATAAPAMAVGPSGHLGPTWWNGGFNTFGFDNCGFNTFGFDNCGVNQCGFNNFGFDNCGLNNCGFDTFGFDNCGFFGDGNNNATFQSTG